MPPPAPPAPTATRRALYPGKLGLYPSQQGMKGAMPPTGSKQSLSPIPAPGVPVLGGDASRFRRRKCQTELEPGGSVENGGIEYRLVARLGSGAQPPSKSLRGDVAAEARGR